MRQLIFYILIFICPGVLFGQYILQDSIQVAKPLTEIALDEQGNIYGIEQNQTLIKIGEQKKISRFKLTGHLNNLRVHSSLLLSLQLNNELHLLDNHLNPTQDPIHLQTAGYILQQTDVIDNNFLIGYDAISHKIIQLNYQLGRIINTSPILTMIPWEEKITKLQYDKKSIYLITDKSLYTFDEFLTFKKKLDIPEYQSILLNHGKIYLQHENQLIIFDPSNSTTTTIYNGKISNFTANRTQLIVDNDKVLYIYKFTN
ncbi:hypothetical protein ACF3NR_03235 [Vaginella massiliensis]|uniref:hypothetical protein n=1 Tax=Vaginella massiliensis TaxID=1816680 RepID=UPI0008396045|nr:hypothetical protein [Vaginella massiliensis]